MKRLIGLALVIVLVLIATTFYDEAQRALSRAVRTVSTLEPVRLRLTLRVLRPNSIRLLGRLVLGWGAARWGQQSPMGQPATLAEAVRL